MRAVPYSPDKEAGTYIELYCFLGSFRGRRVQLLQKFQKRVQLGSIQPGGIRDQPELLPAQDGCFTGLFIQKELGQRDSQAFQMLSREEMEGSIFLVYQEEMVDCGRPDRFASS